MAIPPIPHSRDHSYSQSYSLLSLLNFTNLTRWLVPVGPAFPFPQSPVIVTHFGLAQEKKELLGLRKCA